jgi:hypothetical protein
MENPGEQICSGKSPGCKSILEKVGANLRTKDPCTMDPRLIFKHPQCGVFLRTEEVMKQRRTEKTEKRCPGEKECLGKKTEKKRPAEKALEKGQEKERLKKVGTRSAGSNSVRKN